MAGVTFPIGPLTVARHGAIRRVHGVFLRTFYKGEDVTDRCYYADDTPGRQVAHLFKVNAAGKKYLENGEVAKEVVEGDIEIREGAPV